MTDQQARAATPEGGTRDRSTVRFPYGDLDDAIELAEALYASYGTAGCTLAELAPLLNSTEASSSFKQKVATARTFGVLAAVRASRADLTELGVRLAAGDTDGRAEAFLNVDLYRLVYEEFTGKLLPPDAGLEQVLIGLGVAPAVVKKARQTLQRSAQQAGFHRMGANRLVRPPASSTIKTVAADEPAVATPIRHEEPGMSQNPLLIGLWRMVPDPDDDVAVKKFDSKRQAQWLKAVRANFSLLFPPGPDPETDDNEDDDSLAERAPQPNL